MKHYINLLKDILATGEDKSDRTGIGTKSIFGTRLEFDLSNGFPMLTTRKVSFRISFEEMMFFLRGQTDSSILENKNIKIWAGNTTREFLDKRNLQLLPEKSIGMGYGFQWRNFGGTFSDLRKYENTGFNSPTDDHREGIDQIYNTLHHMILSPHDRRHLVTSWNPAQLDNMALPPCHWAFQLYVNRGKLDLMWHQRSVDVAYGLPYNIMGYAYFNIIFSKFLGLDAGRIIFTGGDTHIYNNQIDMVTEQLEREPMKLPTMTITKNLYHGDFDKFDDAFNNLLSLKYENIEITGYESHPDFKNKPDMAV